MPITLADMLLILLPVLMWIFATLIGWLILNRLLLRPLARMERAVAAYRPGDRELALPRVATPAREIRELGEAFDRAVRTLAHHEAELEAAVERQTKLVREVHHRVKNNLQVVASLLNIHSRGSPNEEVAAAYASIQRRVDALAVVHRNHFAELEENRGVALKPLISELAANLRATAPASALGMSIRLALEPYYVTQDVAVSVAFLITEIAEYAMLCGAGAVSIALTGDGAKPGHRPARHRIGQPASGRSVRRDADRAVRADRHRPVPPAPLDHRPRPRSRPLHPRHRRGRQSGAVSPPSRRKPGPQVGGYSARRVP